MMFFTTRHSLMFLVILLIHSLLILHTLLLAPPPNLFSVLHIPLNTPTDVIRAILLKRSHLTPDLEYLLKRLASFDTRTLYPRFGHNVLATCTYCKSFDDFALYALPRPLLAYIREIAFMGLITLPSSTAPLRKPAVAGIALMGIIEAYTLITVPITIPLRGSHNNITMWHDTLLTVRHIIFLLLPLLIYFLPGILQRYRLYTPSLLAPGAHPTILLAQTHQTLTHLLPTLHVLKYAHAASMRVPALRARVGAWWAEERRVGSWILNDGNDPSVKTVSVRSVARGLGVGFDEANEEGREEGKLRTSAKAAVGGLMADGLKLSQHWPVQRGS